MGLDTGPAAQIGETQAQRQGSRAKAQNGLGVFQIYLSIEFGVQCDL